MQQEALTQDEAKTLSAYLTSDMLAKGIDQETAEQVAKASTGYEPSKADLAEMRFEQLMGDLRNLKAELLRNHQEIEAQARLLIAERDQLKAENILLKGKISDAILWIDGNDPFGDNGKLRHIAGLLHVPEKLPEPAHDHHDGQTAEDVA